MNFTSAGRLFHSFGLRYENIIVHLRITANMELRTLSTNGFVPKNRRQCCEVNGITSNVKNITCGAPQGSCPDPLLSLLCINDLPLASKCSKVTMCADDTSLSTFRDGYQRHNQCSMNTELENRKVWLHS